jgi:hypothetical protein
MLRVASRGINDLLRQIKEAQSYREKYYVARVSFIREKYYIVRVDAEY